MVILKGKTQGQRSSKRAGYRKDNLLFFRIPFVIPSIAGNLFFISSPPLKCEAKATPCTGSSLFDNIAYKCAEFLLIFWSKVTNSSISSADNPSASVLFISARIAWSTGANSSAFDVG